MNTLILTTSFSQLNVPYATVFSIESMTTTISDPQSTVSLRGKRKAPISFQRGAELPVEVYTEISKNLSNVTRAVVVICPSIDWVRDVATAFCSNFTLYYQDATTNIVPVEIVDSGPPMN